MPPFPSIRFVTHHELDDAGLARALEALARGSEGVPREGETRDAKKGSPRSEQNEPNVPMHDLPPNIHKDCTYHRRHVGRPRLMRFSWWQDPRLLDLVSEFQRGFFHIVPATLRGQPR